MFSGDAYDTPHRREGVEDSFVGAEIRSIQFQIEDLPHYTLFSQITLYTQNLHITL